MPKLTRSCRARHKQYIGLKHSCSSFPSAVAAAYNSHRLVDCNLLVSICMQATLTNPPHSHKLLICHCRTVHRRSSPVHTHVAVPRRPGLFAKTAMAANQASNTCCRASHHLPTQSSSRYKYCKMQLQSPASLQQRYQQYRGAGTSDRRHKRTAQLIETQQRCLQSPCLTGQ